MFNQYFNLRENPFSETPDTRFYFKAENHNRVLERMLRILGQGQGFVMLTGEVGTGKTILSRTLIKATENVAETALLLYPYLEGEDLLRTIAEEFGLRVSPESATKTILDQLTDFLIENAQQKKSTILIIDEAQQMSLNALEIIRLLSNIELESTKLLQIILIGQSELIVNLQDHSARQINQRIGARLELESLTDEEVERYIKHRIDIAGGTNFIKFDDTAIEAIRKLSAGIPRLINLQCKIILENAVESKIRIITRKILMEALYEAKVLERYRVFPFGKEEKLVQL